MDISEATSTTVTDSYTWSVTQGVSVGRKITVKAGLPDNSVSVSGEFSMEMSLQESYKKTHTETNSMTNTVRGKYLVPPHSEMKLTFSVIPHKINSSWEMEVTAILKENAEPMPVIQLSWGSFATKWEGPYLFKASGEFEGQQHTDYKVDKKVTSI